MPMPMGGPPPHDDDEFDMEAMIQETQEMLEVRWITRENARFSRTEGGFVALTYDQKEYPRIAVHRTFPFSDPDRWLSIREPDKKAREIGIVKELSDLDSDTQAILREQMAQRYFTPVITQIINIKEEYGFSYFDVVTDHGACRFTAHSGGGAVARLSETRYVITDLEGNRFEIQDLTRFTPGELKKLDLFL